MTRSDVRELAFCFLYELSVQKEDREIQEKLFLESHSMGPQEEEFFRLLVDGVLELQGELDKKIAPCLNKWDITRLPIIDLTILRLALYEMEYAHSVPVSVAISEAVVLAKKYSSDDSRSYINAVLGALSKNSEETSCPEK